VHRVEHEAAARGEDLETIQHLSAHLCGAAQVEYGTGIHPAAPERHVLAEIPLEPVRLHTAGIGLHGVEYLEAGLNEVGYQQVYRAAGMQERMHRRVRPDVVTQLAVPGLEQGPVQLGLHERPRVGTQVIAETHHIDDVAHRLADILQRGQVLFHQGVQQRFHLFRLKEQVHEEVVYAPQESAPLEQVAAHHHHDGAVGVLAQFQRVLPELLPETGLACVVPGGVHEG